MTKIDETLAAVYVCIYIEGFNKINLCEHRERAMYFKQM